MENKKQKRERVIKMNKINMNTLWLVTIVLFIGLSVGAFMQASQDIKTINNMLNESATKGTIITDGINHYTVSNYNPNIDIFSQDYINNLYGNETFNTSKVR